MAEKKSKTKNEPSQKSSSDRIFGSKIMDHGFTAIPNILLRAQGRLGLTTTQFNILAQLLSYYFDPSKPPFPSKRELATRIKITPQTLRINIKALEDAGFLVREQRLTSSGDFSSNTYHLDGLVEKLKKLVPDFDKERADRRKAREAAETPNAKHKMAANEED